MGKQTKILKTILQCFENLSAETLQNKSAKLFNESLIKIYFEKSLNKSDLVRRILNEVVLSNEEIIELLRLLLDKYK